MLFSSIEFIFFFLPLSLIFYFAAPQKARNVILLVFSLVFYGWGEPKYLLLMLATIALDYLFGLLIERNRGRAKLWLWGAVVSNLGSLAVFKYLSPTLGFFGLDFVSLALPVGISFYTFQSLSYVIDVYRGEKAQKDPVAFGAYVTMFPQLVAGPIVRYGDIAVQLKERYTDTQKTARGILRFVCGLSKKLLFANSAGEMWRYFSSLPRGELSTLGAWLGIVFFAFQIYFDFSGYSDMAVGLGLFFGFDFPENFNYPYIATSIRDFWHRWHISLTVWFREYVYIPLGGNRKGEARTLFNMLTVWALTGIWHGASLNFLAWGLYYFILLACERLFWGKLLKRLPRLLSRIYSLTAILVGWVFFSAESIGDAFSYLGRMFSLNAPMGNDVYHLERNIPFLILLILGSTPIPLEAFRSLMQKGGARRSLLSLGSILIFILCVADLVGASYNPFLYFRF